MTRRGFGLSGSCLLRVRGLPLVQYTLKVPNKANRIGYFVLGERLITTTCLLRFLALASYVVVPSPGIEASPSSLLARYWLRYLLPTYILVSTMGSRAPVLDVTGIWDSLHYTHAYLCT